MLLGLIGAYLTATYTYVAPQVAYAQTPEVTRVTLQDRANQIALEYGVSTTTLHNLIQSESEFNPLADNGEDRGIAQISRTFHPEITDEEAFDPEFGLRFAAQVLKDGNEANQYVTCNCFLLVKSRIPNVPHMDQIQPNSGPRIGGIAVMYYGKVKHVAIIEKFTSDGFQVLESNYQHCRLDHRIVSFQDSHLTGFAFY